MNWAELPDKLKVYIVFLVCIALPISIWATWSLFTVPYDSSWLVLTILALLTVPFFLFLPSANATISIGDAYIMAIGMMYGVAPCLAATFLHTLIISVFAQRPKVYAHRVVFNIASTIVGAWLYSSVFQKMNRGSTYIPDIVLSAAALIITYFIANSILTSIAISWSVRESVIKFWAKTCMPLALDFSVSAVAATIIVVSKSFDQYVPLATAPFVGAVWGLNKLNKIKILQAEKHLKDQEDLYMRTVESLALAVDAKDQTTYGHIRRVRACALGLARLCGIKDPNELMAIKTGSLLHDIGKLAVEDYILNKPGRLSKQEFEKIKIHAAAGDEILQQVRFPFPVAKYVRCHHERWDGLGYPDGLKGEEIPLGARILAVSDAFDAIRFSRPYKLSIATDEAVEILRNQAGIAYDPQLIQLFTDHIKELEQAAASESEDAPELSFRKYFETLNRDPSAAPPSPAISRDIPAELIQLAEFCSAVSGHLELRDILQIFARRLEGLVASSTCAFYLDNGNNQVAAVYVSGKFSELLQGHTMELGKGISGWAAAHRRSMINTGPALDFQGLAGDFSSFEDALVVPIIHKEESLGTISLYAEKPLSYGPYDLSILQTLAGILALLISELKSHDDAALADIIDPATQLHRISYLSAVGPQLISFAGKNRSPISLIYIEIRNLGQIVRLFGGNLGNSVLRKAADCIKPELRETDILVRYGHQGFVAFLPGVREEQALRCVQRLKQQIRNEVLTSGNQSFSVDCKAGVSSYPEDGTTIFALLQSAQEKIRSGSLEPASESNIVDFPPRA